MIIKTPITVKFTFWLLLASLYYKNLHAQSYIADIEKLSLEDGLSNRFVNDIRKDNQGFMWFASDYGLNRYDGHTFKLYTAENSGLTSNRIHYINEDNDQKLWLISHDMTNRFRLDKVHILDLKTDSIQPFEQAFKAIAPFTTRNIRYVYSDTHKNMWILTTENQLYRYSNGRFEYIFSSPEQVIEIVHVDNKYVWLAGKDFIMTNLQGDILKKLPGRERQDFMVFDKNNDFWFFQLQQKKLLQGNNKKASFRAIDLEPLKLPEKMYEFNYTRKIYINATDKLIWCYQKDIPDPFFLVIHPEKGIVYDLYEKIKPFLTYGEFHAFTIYPDTENRFWIGTSDGVFIITLKKNKFTTFLSNTPKNYSARGIIEDNKETIYINTYMGRMLVSSGQKEVKKNNDDIWLGATRDKEGYLWFGHQGRMIEKYNPLEDQSYYYHYQDDSDPIPFEQWAIIRDKTGRVWTGAYQGLYFLEPQTDRYQRFTRYNTFSQLGESTVYHLYEDEKGIWIASSSGLYLLEPGKGITARYATDEKTPYRIPYDHLLHFYRDSEGTFWLATKNGGLIRFNSQDGSCRQFTTADGLSSNIIYAVYEDDYDKLWLPSNYGLMYFDKSSYRLITYLKDDGIAHNEFNTGSHYQGTDGRLYFGGLTGVTAFHPKDFIAGDVVAPLRMTGCKILNGKTGKLTDNTRAVINSGELTLSPSDKSFILEFALLNYENTKKNSYAYIIKGLDKDWTTIEENRLRINALPYGNYTLHIKGKGIKGEKSSNELTIPIVVNKPFYLKNSFIIACTFTLILLIYGAFRWRLQNLRQAKVRLQETIKERTAEIRQQKDKIEKQAIKLQELDKVKSRFFANISHELRTPLTLILGPSGNMISSLKGKEKVAVKNISKPLNIIQRNGKQLLRLIEEILDLSKLDAHKLEVHESPVAFYNYIKRLFSTFEPHAVQRNIHYQLQYELEEDIYLLLDTNKVEKVIINYLSNAFKYSPDGAEISLRLSVANQNIHITVQDSGEGIHPKDLPYVFDRFYQSGQSDVKAQGGTGIGLALCKELAELIGGSVAVESQWGKGSIFSCILPKKAIVPLPFSQQQKRDPETLEEIQTEVEETAAIPLQKEHTLLVVEDNDDMRDFIVSILQDHYHIRTATDGEKALDQLKKEQSLPDLILSDVMMPRMDGFTLLEKVKSNKQWRKLPMMMLTARAAKQDKLKALTTGVDDYLVKPFDREELLVRIRNLLVNYSERKQWQGKESEKVAMDVSFKAEESWDTAWLRQAETIVKREMVNFKYKVSDLAAEMLISERQLLQKMKQITGLTPQQFIRELKLQKARSLLENRTKNTIAEISYAVGFDTPGYFSKVYKDRFGKGPAEYLH